MARRYREACVAPLIRQELSPKLWEAKCTKLAAVFRKEGVTQRNDQLQMIGLEKAMTTD